MNNINTNTDVEMSQQSKICQQYHQELIPEFTRSTTENITQRVNEMIVIINRNQWFTSKPIKFIIDTQTVITAAMQQITPIIKSNTLVDITSCKIVPGSKTEYRKIARNRLNRNKPKFVGNFVFGPLVFDRLYNFCCKEFDDNGIASFVSTLRDILAPESMIRFKQTRAQPLIPYNTFVFENAFRNSCVMLLRHYGLEQAWKVSKKKRVNAKDKWHCFIMQCLPALSQKCHRKDYRAPRCLFISQRDTYSTRTPIIEDIHCDDPCDTLPTRKKGNRSHENSPIIDIDLTSSIDMHHNVQLDGDDLVTEYGNVQNMQNVQRNSIPSMMEYNTHDMHNWQTATATATASSILSPHSDTTPINNQQQHIKLPSMYPNPVTNQFVFDAQPSHYPVFGHNNHNLSNCDNNTFMPMNPSMNTSFQANQRVNVQAYDHYMNNNRFSDAVIHHNSNNYYGNNCSYGDFGHNAAVNDCNVNHEAMENKEDYNYSEMESVCPFGLDPPFMCNNESTAIFDDNDTDFAMN